MEPAQRKDIRHGSCDFQYALIYVSKIKWMLHDPNFLVWMLITWAMTTSANFYMLDPKLMLICA